MTRIALTPVGRSMTTRDRLGLALLAAVAYVPLLATDPGGVSADTKSYLTLDPSRLLARAWSMWDPSIGLGTVTHQNIVYLWPTGPWYWLFDRVGAPDWVAQRLWLGSILFLAGAGTVYLLRTLRWRGPEVWAAAFAYALTPYVLTVAARLSIILLPFAALPWMIALTVRACREPTRWRYPAVLALVIATAGSGNLTALVLAGVGPALWVLYVVAVERALTVRSAAAMVAKVGGLALATSAWWLGGLWVQAGWGIDVLDYSETAAAVAATSLAPEVLRGLGYWFFYGDDKLGPWIEPSVSYTQSPALLGLSYGLPALGLAAAGLARFGQRTYFVALALVGTVLAVGAYPWDDPPLVGEAFKVVLASDRGLALRSLPRAAPLVALALAVLLAAGVGAVGRARPRWALPLTAAAGVLALANLPTLWQGQMVPDNLRRDDVPAYWYEAAATLDRDGGDSRVLVIPGSDFASYRWGNTVDPVLPGLMDRPSVARELIPYGSPATADLLNALDRRLQENVFDPAALAPVARLMGAGDVVVRSDLQFERYKTPRPRALWSVVTAAPGLAAPVSFGTPRPNEPSPELPLRDEAFLQIPPDAVDPPPVAAFAVDDAVPIIETVTGPPLVVAGDGEGLVEAAAAGLLDGDELVLYAASYAAEPDRLRQRMGDDGALLVTDSNRRQGTRWTTVRHNSGFTEEAGAGAGDGAGDGAGAGPGGGSTDLTDNRLPVFPEAGDDSFTVALHRGGVHAAATSYGNPITFTPEDRPANAVDGDPTTAWRTGAFSPAMGERLVLSFDEPVTTGSLTLLQPGPGVANRFVTRARLHFGDGRSGATLDVDVGEASRAVPGQRVDIGERTFSRLEIELLADTAGRPPRYRGLTSVGFAEIGIGGAPGADDLRLDEVIRVPTDLLDTAGRDSLDHPLAVLLARMRTDPADPTRSDEEPALARSVTLPTPRSFTLSGEARLSARAPDPVLDELLGLPAAEAGGLSASSSARLPGARGARASVTVDGDTTTAWTGTFGAQEGQWLEYRRAVPVSADRLGLTVVADGYHSVPTRLGVIADGARVGSVDLPAVEDGDRRGAVATVEVDVPEFSASTVRLVVEAVRPVDTIEWNSGAPVAMPVSVAEVDLGGIAAGAPQGDFDSGCLSMVDIDGATVPVRVTGSVADAVAGAPLAVASCPGPVALGAGEHVLRTADGRRTGIDIDRLVLRSAPGGRADPTTGALVGAGAGAGDGEGRAGTTAEADVAEASPWRTTVRVDGATPGQAFWLVMGQSYNEGWTASLDGVDLGEPELVDGYANGWLVTPASPAGTVTLTFAPQRVVLGALVVSLLAALGALAIALAGFGSPRRRPVDDGSLAKEPPGAGGPEPFSARRWLSYPGARPSTVSGVLAAVALGGAFAAVIGAVPGLVVGVATLGATRRAGLRPMLTLGAPVLLGLCGAYVIALQVRDDIPPGFEWPAEFSRAHAVGWLAVAFVVADVVVGRLYGGNDAEPGAAPPTGPGAA